MQSDQAILKLFEKRAREITNSIDSRLLEIDFLGICPHAVRSPSGNQLIVGPYVQAQLVAGTEGICFPEGHIDISSSFQYVGKNVFSVLDKVPLEVEIALIDAAFGIVNQIEGIKPKESIELRGTPSIKAQDRAKYITSLINPSKGEKVGIVGFIGPMVKNLLEVDCKVRIADLHSLHTEFNGIHIEKEALPIIEWADKLIITGGSLWTSTLDIILNEVAKTKKLVLIYSMTGHNFAPYYLNHGASIVTVEYFPFYWFANTSSRLDVFRDQIG